MTKFFTGNMTPIETLIWFLPVFLLFLCYHQNGTRSSLYNSYSPCCTLATINGPSIEFKVWPGNRLHLSLTDVNFTNHVPSTCTFFHELFILWYGNILNWAPLIFSREHQPSFLQQAVICLYWMLIWFISTGNTYLLKCFIM